MKPESEQLTMDLRQLSMFGPPPALPMWWNELGREQREHALMGRHPTGRNLPRGVGRGSCDGCALLARCETRSERMRLVCELDLGGALAVRRAPDEMTDIDPRWPGCVAYAPREEGEERVYRRVLVTHAGGASGYVLRRTA